MRVVKVLIIVIISLLYKNECQAKKPIATIITNNGDTIVAPIRINWRVYSKVVYKDSNKKWQRLYPDQVKFYSFTYRKRYLRYIPMDCNIVMPKKTDKHFCRVIETGRINLYEYKAVTVGVSATFSNGILAILPYPKRTIRYLMQIGDSTGVQYVAIRNANFRNQMNIVLQGDTPLLKKINTYEYTVYEIDKVVREYNYWYVNKDNEY